MPAECWCPKKGPIFSEPLNAEVFLATCFLVLKPRVLYFRLWGGMKWSLRKISKLFHFQSADSYVAHEAGIEQVSSDWWPLIAKFIVLLDCRNYLWDLQTDLGSESRPNQTGGKKPQAGLTSLEVAQTEEKSSFVQHKRECVALQVQQGGIFHSL